jgi:hypothetical protein
MELPVEYHPRTRDEGKKTRPSDGFKVLRALLRFKRF